jgi:oligopeptide/dipeptide ABC transporter ATP-binding protein
LEEAITAHAPTTGSEVHRRAFEALRSVEIPEAAYRLADYPHQFSGGMRQRVAIAMALINGPSVLIADEPTTALDVTLQAHVLGLLRRLASDLQLAVLLITHDLATVGAVCDRVAVMYAGQVVEEGPVSDVFNSPQHPYTHGLLESRAAGHEEARRLPSMKGMPPELTAIPTGCRFVVRCPLAIAQCAQPPALLALDAARQARCWVSQRGGRLPEVIWE